MVETTRSITELRKDVDDLKESSKRTEKTLEEMRTMMASMFANQNQHNVHGGLGHFGENGGESPLNRGAPWMPGYQIPSKVSRVDFPHFNGEDLRRWLYRCEQFFEVDDTPSNAKVKLVAVHLEGKALQWHQMLMKGRMTREVPNWEEYIRALNNRFGALVYDDPMSELVNLKQVGTIQQYLDKFDEIVNCMDLPDHYALRCFLGNINWNFSQLKMEFMAGNKKILLRGMQPSSVKLISRNKMRKLIRKPSQAAMLHVEVFQNNAEATSHIFNLQRNTIQDKLQLQNVLEEFGDLFEEPNSSPPHRDQDHKIILKEGIDPISLRPYRYPARQKDKIEKMVQSLLDTEVIRPSTSPFSSPIVMVKKKDGSWQECVDYRAVNAATIGNAPCTPKLPVMLTPHGFLVLEPEKILDRRVVNRNNRAATQWLIKWFNAPIEESTWEFLHDFED
ncbi:hypothetical protein BUALT_Bualt04G0043300 [Buddleja alternifolia]|uniref:Chromo domain-containing protein n=1 Tax=Buddleja alternifolia TaxID=168488 RepID=A0AAV6XL83_9LAMI|nr:hypothetical protein BUALT_Bualt04G0043300 [Buddleja alternifolia]